MLQNYTRVLTLDFVAAELPTVAGACVPGDESGVRESNFWIPPYNWNLSRCRTVHQSPPERATG